MNTGPDFELVPEMLSAYLDDELTGAERAAVDTRLAESPEWRAELEEVRAARATVRSLAARDAPSGFWDAVLAHVEAGEGEGEGDGDGEVTPVPVVPLAERRPRRRVAWFAAAAAAVAGIVVAVIAVPQRTEVTPNVTAVVAQHGAQGSDTGDPISMLAPVGPLAGFRR
jgi:anti-sigma factor RsiW